MNSTKVPCPILFILLNVIQGLVLPLNAHAFILRQPLCQYAYIMYLVINFLNRVFDKRYDIFYENVMIILCFPFPMDYKSQFLNRKFICLHYFDCFPEIIMFLVYVTFVSTLRVVLRWLWHETRPWQAHVLENNSHAWSMIPSWEKLYTTNYNFPLLLKSM